MKIETSRTCLSLGATLLLTALLAACGGGGTASSPGGGSGGSGGAGGGSGGGGGGNSFTPRPFPNDFFMRLPSQDSGENVPHLAYDSALKEIFVCNPDINAVDAYSTVDGHWVGEIAVPGPAGVSLSPDGSTLVIGTITPYIYFANPTTLHITRQIALPASALTTDALGNTVMPVMPYAMADGTIFLGMGINTQSTTQAYTGVVHLIRYAPSSDTFTPQDPGAGGAGGIPVRSGDGKTLLASGLSASGAALFLYSTDAQAYIANTNSAPPVGSALAANANGSQFATIQPYPDSTAVTFWGSNLQMQGQYIITSSVAPYGGAVYSRDGKFLYVVTASGVLVSLNTQTYTPAGYLGLSIGGLIAPLLQFFDADENYHLFGVAQPGGALILNAAQTSASAPAAIPNFIEPTTEANPNVGPLAGGTSVQFITGSTGSGSADGVAASMEAYFGSTPAPQDTVAPYPSSSDGGNFLTAVAPPATAPGPVTVVLNDANNNTVFLPDAYTFGPKLLRVVPNLAGSAGGDTINVVAYGLGFFDLNEIQVTIGGAQVNLTNAVLEFLRRRLSRTIYHPPSSSRYARLGRRRCLHTQWLHYSFAWRAIPAG